MNAKRTVSTQANNQAESEISKKKVYVLDTNVLVHDPRALFSFKGAHVIVPIAVLEELDRFKAEGTDRGRNSRQVIRSLDQLREKGSLGKGVLLEDGGTIQVLFFNEEDMPELPFSFSIADNDIILNALFLQRQGNDVSFISKDLNARVKADSLGLCTEDYVKEFITESEFYRGWRSFKIPASDLKRGTPNILLDIATELTPNEFVLLESQSNPYNYSVYRHLSQKKFKQVHQPHISWPFQSHNAQQLMALDLLFDEEVQFVCLFGPAGTGKTFLALLSGLHQVLVGHQYQKMLVSRPIIPLGKDIGFLPGTVEEKLRSWMLPIYDNMEYIARTVNASHHFDQREDSASGSDYDRKNYKKKRHHHNNGKKKSVHQTIFSIDELIKRQLLSLEAITYMRGRSIPDQFILIDEAQNLTPHEIKTLVTRVGEGSKIILAGDPYQIDSPYLDFASNGLIVSSERFKGEKIFGTVYLQSSERSQLSQLASDLL